MKKREILFLGLILMISMRLVAEDPKKLLKKVRDDYYKQEKIRTTSPKKLPPTEQTVVFDSEEIEVSIDGEYPTLEREKEPKPRNAMERLERTAEKATIQADYYERVVRSVAREESELKDYNQVLGKKKTKFNKEPKVTGLGK